jgi:hypothetical protein
MSSIMTEMVVILLQIVDISSRIGTVSPPKEPGNDAHFEKSGDS